MTDKTAIFADGFASKVSKSSSLGKVCILEHVTKYGNFLSGSVIKTRGVDHYPDILPCKIWSL